jgi:biotin carboxylase
MSDRRPTILCLASYEKGHEFLRQCRAQGWRVLLLTSHSLKDVAEWPREAIDEIFYMPDHEKKWNLDQTVRAVSYVARTERIARIVPLDDFDLETAAALREHLRVPGMGETTTRYFRDKLAMRVRARAAGIAVPDFVHVLNHDDIREFCAHVPPPWMLKPRFMAGSIGLAKIEGEAQLWQRIAELGDEASMYLLEKYLPGEVFHVDSLVFGSEVRFALASQYGRPPFDAAHGGDVFSTRVLPRDGELARALVADTKTILHALRLVRGAAHTELIRSREDGKLYFLETAARVGGANIADMIEAATGLNPWREWAKIELAGEEGEYRPLPSREEYAGLINALAKVEHVDPSLFDDPEVVWRSTKRWHVGLVVRSPDPERVETLLERYVDRIRRELLAFIPPPARPGD